MKKEQCIACSVSSVITPGKDGKGFTWSDTVPKGGQIIQTFELTPALPGSDKKAKRWKLIDPCQKEREGENISAVVIDFHSASTLQEREHERAVLIVELQQNPEEKGTWRFAFNGVQVKQVQVDDSDIGVEISDDGKRLIAYVHAPLPTDDPIHFGFVASYTDESGEIKTFESHDPDVSPIRPK